MSKAPSMPMYWDAYLADTTHLSTEEHGAYLLLLAAMWRRNGSVPDDDKDNARILGLTVGKWRKTKARFLSTISGFVIENDLITQDKLQKTWKNTQEKIAINAANGAKGGRAAARKNNSLGEANATNSVQRKATIPEPEPYRDTNVSHSVRSRPKPERFQEFWDQYPHRGGAKKNRKQAMAKYARAVASGVSEQTIISAAIRYASDAQVLRGYGRNPDVWLNNEGWNDDIEPVGNSQRGGNTGRSGPHDSLMAGFAAFANSDDDAGGSDFGGDQTIDGTCDEEMDSRSSGCGSKPVFRVIGSG